MSHDNPPTPSGMWHQTRTARNLIVGLAAEDVRLVLSRGCPGPDQLVWHPASDHGADTFDALAALRVKAVGWPFTLATDDCARTVALAAAQHAPTVASALATRFGDCDRWLGFGAVEATRRFRANWA